MEKEKKKTPEKEEVKEPEQKRQKVEIENNLLQFFKNGDTVAQTPKKKRGRPPKNTLSTRVEAVKK